MCGLGVRELKKYCGSEKKALSLPEVPAPRSGGSVQGPGRGWGREPAKMGASAFDLGRRGCPAPKPQPPLLAARTMTL